MKKKLLFLFILYGTFSCFARENINSTLWKISGNGLKTPSYVFGTIHAMPADQFEFTDTLLKYLEASEYLVMELNPDIPLKEQFKLIKQMYLPEGKTIRDYMDSVYYNLLYEYLRDSLHVKEDRIKVSFSMKPVFMQSLLLTEYIEKPVTYETEIMKKAGKRKKFMPLETIQQQMDMLDSIPYELQLAFEGENYKLDKEYYALLTLYLQQDLAGLDSLIFSDPQFNKIEYNLLTNRNYNWLPKILDAMQNGSCFIAVGCAHLIGENGLINLLRKEGFIVEAVLQDY